MRYTCSSNSVHINYACRVTIEMHDTTNIETCTIELVFIVVQFMIALLFIVGLKLANILSLSSHLYSSPLSLSWCIHHWACQQGHCAYTTSHCCHLFLLGHFPWLCWPWHYTHVLTRVEWVDCLLYTRDVDSWCIVRTGSISDPKLWLDAISQNAWDTGKYLLVQDTQLERKDSVHACHVKVKPRVMVYLVIIYKLAPVLVGFCWGLPCKI